MARFDEETLERVIEQITRQVLIMVQEQELAPGSEGTVDVPQLSSRNYVDQVQPVVRAGADRIASTLGVAPTDGTLSHMIDHTILKADASQDQIAQLCYEARKHNFISV